MRFQRYTLGLTNQKSTRIKRISTEYNNKVSGRHFTVWLIQFTRNLFRSFRLYISPLILFQIYSGIVSSQCRRMPGAESSSILRTTKAIGRIIVQRLQFQTDHKIFRVKEYYAQQFLRKMHTRLKHFSSKL